MKLARLYLPMVLVLAAVPTVFAQAPPKPFDVNSVAHGRTYSEWSAAWWQWAYSIPVASHPLFDNGDCSVGQSGPVWFLGGKFGQTGSPAVASEVTRYCSLPAGKALYFPLSNVADSAPEEPNWGCGDTLPPLKSGTIAEMRACAAMFVTTTNLEADLDGARVPNLKNYRVQSIEFDATWPDDNLLTAIGEGPFPAGTFSPVVDDGIYLLLPPLTPGQHTLHFQAGSSENITYYLTVTK